MHLLMQKSYPHLKKNEIGGKILYNFVLFKPVLKNFNY